MVDRSRGLGCSVPAGHFGHQRIEAQKRHLVIVQPHLAQLKNDGDRGAG
jgi:hypothetical protein